MAIVTIWAGEIRVLNHEGDLVVEHKAAGRAWARVYKPRGLLEKRIILELAETLVKDEGLMRETDGVAPI